MGNGYTTTLPLEVFTQRNTVADFIRLKLNLIQNKNKNNRFFSHPLGDLGQRKHSIYTARWKARVRLLIRHN